MVYKRQTEATSPQNCNAFKKWLFFPPLLVGVVVSASWSDRNSEVAPLKIKPSGEIWLHVNNLTHYSVFVHPITFNRAKCHKNSKTHSRRMAQSAVLRQQQWSHLVLCESHLRTTTKSPLICANQMTLNSHLLLNWAPVHAPSSFRQPPQTLAKCW